MIIYSIILPAYNEAQTIESALNAVRATFDEFNVPYEIIVVDDGSRDQTAELVEFYAKGAPTVRLLRHARNQGKGAAVRAGVLAARGEWILYMDCDLSVHPSQVRDFLPHLTDADAVIGSRTVRGARIPERQPGYRVLLGKLFNLAAVRWYLGLPYHDTQCGFKVFKQKTKPLFRQLQSSGWAFDAELLLRARKAGFRVVELPVTWRHGRVSRVRLGDVWRIAKELYRIKRLMR